MLNKDFRQQPIAITPHRAPCGAFPGETHHHARVPAWSSTTTGRTAPADVPDTGHSSRRTFPWEMMMRLAAAVTLLSLTAAFPAAAQLPNVQQMLQGLTSGDQSRDQALQEAFERGYQRGRQDEARNQSPNRGGPPGGGGGYDRGPDYRSSAPSYGR
jgi:hypothetical protein